tara:strand:- start:246 stop:872 length:627 start_codon:yes stop_codon:yes gene_type:complete
MIVNKRAAERLNIDYEFIKFENDDNIDPRAMKIKIINNVLKNTKYKIIIFIDSDAWIHDVINLNNIINYFIDSNKHGSYSRDPPPFDPEKEVNISFNINHNNTYINSGVFMLIVNDFTKNMYHYLENELIEHPRKFGPFDQSYISKFVYKNKNDFLIFESNVLNSPKGKVIRHNWWKNNVMHEDLDYLIKNDIDINYNENFDFKMYIQ